MKIITLQKNNTTEYAASELKKYITALSRGSIVPDISSLEVAPNMEENTIILGTLGELSLDESDLFDDAIEDILDIDVENLSGYIAGSNRRSILMGVYRFLSSAGCRFLRPGEGGDYIPEADLYNHSFKYRKKADYPFRGQCVEGAVSYEHIRDTIYWLPKVMMNSYMIECEVPYEYMNRWYSHSMNAKYRSESQDIDYDIMEKYTALIEKDIEKTGMQLHSLGHGWMFNVLGFKTGNPKDEERAKKEITEEQKKHLALVGGKREVMYNHSFYTHLCYSNPETRKMLVDFIVNYAKNKPHIDFIHVWLADAINNWCECDECVKMHPSDYYVLLLNEIDERLTEMGSDAKLVFIMYHETTRPPQKLRLKNPKRFILLSAIGLHYEKGYVNEEYKGEIPPFIRNRYEAEPNPLRLQWHREWKALSGNIPSFIFEYRFYKDMYCDLGHMRIARETCRDMKSLENVNFQGCINDQTHRLHIPTSLPLILMGETLFDKNTDFEKVADDYFKSAFGEDSDKCREYLEKLSSLSCTSNLRVGGTATLAEMGLGTNEVNDKCWFCNEYVANCAMQIPKHVKSFEKVIRENITKCENMAQKKSWIYLMQYSKICTLFSNIIYAGAKHGVDAAREKLKDFETYVSEHEMEFHEGFDVFLSLLFWYSKLDMKHPDIR